MAGENTLATAAGIAKEQYGELKDARPKQVKVQRRIGFNARKKLGKRFVEPVWMSDEQGITYDDGTAGNAWALNAAVAAESVEASASGTEMAVRVSCGIKPISTALSQGDQAFASFYSQMLGNAKKSIHKRLELSLIHGGEPIGTVSSSSGSSGAYALTLTGQSWVPGAWLGSKGTKIDVYTSGGSKRNTTTDVIVTSVNPASKIVNIAGLDSEVSNIANTDVIYFKGAKDAEFDGLKKICGLASGESYLGIAAASYLDLWTGHSETCSDGPFEFSDLQKGLMAAAGKGGEGDYVCLLSHASWGNMADDLNGLRAIDDSYDKSSVDYGSKGFKFHTVTGTVEFIPTLHIDEGSALAFPVDMFKRIGSTDITFEMPGRQQSFFRELDGAMGVEIRGYSDQAVWTTDVKSCVHFTNITN